MTVLGRDAGILQALVQDPATDRISMRGVVMMLAIAAAPSPPRVGDVGKLLGIYPSLTSDLLDRLVSRGLVMRLPSQDDLRVTHVDLTQDGWRVVSLLARIWRPGRKYANPDRSPPS